MHVHRADHPRHPHAPKPAPAPAPTAQQTTPTGDADTVELTSTPAPSTEPGKVPGVVRLLHAGHFKGVADVRLRIVHADKLAQFAPPPTPATEPPTLDELRAAVDEQLATLPDVGELTEEQTTAVQSAQEAFNAALDAIDPAVEEGRDEALGAARTQLMTSLQETLVGDAAEPTGYEDLLSTLDGKLGELIDRFAAPPEASIDPFAALPPLSPPTGSGKAYAKFLAQYQAMLGEPTEPAAPATVEAPTTTAPLDAVA